MGQAGGERAAEYSWPRVTQQVVDFYREIRAQAASAGS
jgi:hypothetical protein